MVEDSRFEEVWNAHGRAVLRYATYSTGSSDAGEDVAAETFARFLAKGDRVADEHLEAWLIRVARNLCASHHRRAQRSRRLEIRLAEVTSVRGADEPLTPWWAAYVSQLSETERLTIYLRVVEGRPFAEVAELLAKSESATKMTFYRAIDRLRRDMKRDGVGQETSLVGGADCV